MENKLSEPTITAHSLAQNTLWNFLGQGLPLLVAIVAIPMLIEGLGMERFGILTLVWVMIGYSNLFDFGLGRAMTKLVAEKRGSSKDEEIESLVWTGLYLMLIFGVLGALLFGFSSEWLAKEMLEIPPELHLETLRSFNLIAISIPVVIITTGMKGVLEAYQRFDLIIRVSIPLGIFNFIGPLLTLILFNNLSAIVSVLLIARLVAVISYIILCIRVNPNFKRIQNLNPILIKSLIGFGGWMTITNIIGPLMDYFDRFLIGSVISMAAVAYYSTPYDVVSRLWIIPAALTGVLFPAFSYTIESNKNQLIIIFRKGFKYIFLILFPLILTILAFSQEILAIWLGSDFALKSHSVLQLLTIGVFINSLARLPYALIQASGRPDFTAKLHILELPFYLLMVWWLTKNFGIEGAAFAWLIRVACDGMALFYLVRKFLPNFEQIINFQSYFIPPLLLFPLCFLSIDTISKGFFVIIFLTLFTLFTWHRALDNDEILILKDLFLKKKNHD